MQVLARDDSPLQLACLPAGECLDRVLRQPDCEEEAKPLIPANASGHLYAALSRFCSKRRRRRCSDATTARRRIESRSPGKLKNPPLLASGVSAWK